MYMVDEMSGPRVSYAHAARLTDGSMKGTADPELVKKLSFDRANAVKQALVTKFQLPDGQFTVNGLGWTRPADPTDPDNHAKNRRVEVKVVPAEAQ